MNLVNQWLSERHANGYELGIKELLHYQNKPNLLDLSPRRTIQAKLAGSYLAKTKGRGMEFDEARHYQQGDDIRAIDWRVTARTGKTHTKIYREEKERPVFILADLSASMYFGTQYMFKSVQVAHLASLIAWSAQKRGDRIGGLVFNQQQHREYKPYTRRKAVLSFLHGMIEFHQTDNPTQQFSFAEACARVRRLAHPGSVIFILSDFLHLDETARQHISRMTRHCEVIAHPITDPFEHALPKVAVPQQVAMTDGKAQQTITLGERETELQYQQQHQQHYEKLIHTLKQSRCQVKPISSALPLEQQVGGKSQ
ncbi:DUF58 domain-containing protein [Neptunicella marina]|uniref:DUF58 domain-containing protein n=1 Tax=Neptunicella marina TaxID=2125989 RepID=A0A8J6M023_9ALTE|nr:DUF58 domain-containing protein [Neptunicella marina]MBC3766730.1 DUF58 domain-containing protein [Neptunicella marina]